MNQSISAKTVKGMLVLFLVASLTRSSSASAQRIGTQEGSVTMRIADPMTQRLRWRVVSFAEVNGKRDLTSHFSGLHGEQIPFGVYEFRLFGEPPPMGERCRGGSKSDRRRTWWSLGPNCSAA